MQPQTPRKLPIRRCAGCGGHFPKNELIRVLRTPEGEITLDGSGKKSGRGVYLCKNPSCFKKARKANRLSAALSCNIPTEVYDRLEEELSRDAT